MNHLPATGGDGIVGCLLRPRLTAARAAVTAGALLIAGLAGCDKPEGDKAGNPATSAAASRAEVGVVDFDRVFKELGWMDSISASMQSLNAELKQTVDAFGRDLQAALDDTREKISDAAKLTSKQRDDFAAGRELDKLPLTPQQKEEWGRSVNNAGSFFQRASAQAQQISRERENQLVVSYRDSMQPALRRAAESSGMTLLTNPAQVVYFHSSVDVTNKVIDDLRAAPPPHKLPDPPKLELPKIQLSAPPPQTTGPTTGPTTSPSVSPNLSRPK